MDEIRYMLFSLGGFLVLVMASRQIGDFFTRIRFPLISGFLITGILIGPYFFNFVGPDAILRLQFIDRIALAFIAFAAGAELRMDELRAGLRSVLWNTGGQVVATFAVASGAMFLLAGQIPFMAALGTEGRIAVSLLAGSILVARSPSSAIAIIRELRAKGPFTNMILGTTVITDVAVITLFGVSISVAESLLLAMPLDLNFIFCLLIDIGGSVVLGLTLAKLLQGIISPPSSPVLKILVILALGWAAFVLTEDIREVSLNLGHMISLEPLLVCMIAGFRVGNYSPHRTEFHRLLQTTGPSVYVLFFTLTGASLALDVLLETWHIAATLFLVRLLGLVLGSVSGGSLARDPWKSRHTSWMAFVTQAGIGLGLAKGVAVDFPEWGNQFSTLIISVIVLNQLVGPPLFKWAVTLMGEAHPRGDERFDGVREVVIFGLEGQSLALARQLRSHSWQVKIATCNRMSQKELDRADVPIVPIRDFSVQTMRYLGMERADTLVALMSDEENHQICETAYETFGTHNMVVRLNHRKNQARFADLGVTLVQPFMAMVSLLDHFVRSPAAAALILGMEEGQDVVELEVRDPALHGLTLRELHLPLDTLVLSVSRDSHMLVSHGYTRLELGDHVTVVGTPGSLEDVRLMLSAPEPGGPGPEPQNDSLSVE